MTSDSLGSIPFDRPGNTFGLGLAITTHEGLVGELGSTGELRWSGAAGTRFWIDPEEDLIGIFMMQISPANGLPYSEEFKTLVYQAISH